MTKAIFFEREFEGKIVDFCRISNPGMTDIWEGPVRSTDLQRFSDEWQSYKKTKKKVKKTGSKLNDLPGMSEPRRVELELHNIETIEELAAADEVSLREMGDPFVQLHKVAELHVEAKKAKEDLVVEVAVAAQTLAEPEVKNEPANNSTSR